MKVLKPLRLIFLLSLSHSLLSCVSAPLSPQRPAGLQILRLEKSPLVGKTKANQEIYLGGFSALQFVKKDHEKFYFLSLTDRGPNAEETQKKNGDVVRPFLLPDFPPQLIEFSYDQKNQSLNIENHRPFLTTEAKGLSGLPPDSSSVANNNLERPSDVFGNILKNAPAAMDSEGLCVFHEGYLVSEEYGPDLLQFDRELKLQHRWGPAKGLPAEYALRKTNRGFEGLACDQKYAYLFLQSPLKKTGLAKDQEHIRLAQFNPLTGQTEKEFYYPVQSEKADKIGDMALVKDKIFLVIEQNGQLGPQGVRRIYKIDLDQADSENRLQKQLVVDLNSLNFDFVEKIEGIAVLDPQTVAIVIDNDFGLAGPINLKTGEAIFKKDPFTYMAIIHLDKVL